MPSFELTFGLARFHMLHDGRPDLSQNSVPAERALDFWSHGQLVGGNFGSAVYAFVE